MTGQMTLEEVGVKRARTEETGSKESSSKDGQPDPKKAHNQSENAQQISPAASKENEGSKSNKQGIEKSSEKPKADAGSKAEQVKEEAPKSSGKVTDAKPKAASKDATDPQAKSDVADVKPKAESNKAEDPQIKSELKEEAAPKEEADPKASLPSSVPKPEGVVEEGRIYFLYRPRVNVDHPTSIDDIQRFFMILAPTSRPKAPFRLLIIGKKRLPTAEGHERFFGFVEATADSMEKLTGDLGETGNQSATMGYRTTEPARICGEGVYEIVDRGGRKTSFAYKLEIPKEPGEVQKELQIRQEASYTLSIKNPGTNDPPNAGLNNKADFKGSQKKQFGGYRWIGCHDPSLLDMQRCEFLFIGARGGEDIKTALGEAAEHLEKAAEEDLDNYMQNVAPDGVDEHTAMLAKLRDETKAAEANLPTDAAATGKWQ